MKFFVIIAAIIVAVNANFLSDVFRRLQEIGVQVRDHLQRWEDFKQNFNRVYDTEDLEIERFIAFTVNYYEITYHNQLFDEGKVTYKKGITKFADLTANEFYEWYLREEHPIKIYGKSKNTNKNESDCLDWSERGAVTRVKDQGMCGSSWIFGAVGVLEGYYYRKTKKLVSLSEQNMVDCIKPDGCSGGFPKEVFKYLQSRDKGINKEKDYPYEDNINYCRYDKAHSVKVNFKRYRHIQGTEDDIKKALIKHGPIVVAVAATPNWQLYESDVWYETICSEAANHALLLVGYGSENGHDYWLLKNSWGEKWGENGFMKFSRNKHENYCGFTDNAYYLT